MCTNEKIRLNELPQHAYLCSHHAGEESTVNTPEVPPRALSKMHSTLSNSRQLLSWHHINSYIYIYKYMYSYLLIYINFKEQTLMQALRIAASRMGISRVKWLFRLLQPLTLERHWTRTQGLEPETWWLPISPWFLEDPRFGPRMCYSLPVPGFWWSLQQLGQKAPLHLRGLWGKGPSHCETDGWRWAVW